MATKHKKFNPFTTRFVTILRSSGCHILYKNFGRQKPSDSVSEGTIKKPLTTQLWFQTIFLTGCGLVESLKADSSDYFTNVFIAGK